MPTAAHPAGRIDALVAQVRPPSADRYISPLTPAFATITRCPSAATATAAEVIMDNNGGKETLQFGAKVIWRIRTAPALVTVMQRPSAGEAIPPPNEPTVDKVGPQLTPPSFDHK